MIKGIIVDDEDIVRLTLMSIVDWDALGIEIVGSYANGKQVISHMEHKDDVRLIITDINMPILNGLDLIKHLNKDHHLVEYLVISAYDDYELVREAFKLGVTDYILKQNISKETITTLVKTIVSRIDTSSLTNASDEKRDIEDWLISILFSGDHEGVYQATTRTFLDNYALCFLCVEEYREVMKHFGAEIEKDFLVPFRQTIMQIESPTNRLYLVNEHKNEFVLIVNFKAQEMTPASNKQELRSMVARITTQLKSFLNVKVTASVSEVSSDVKEMKNLFKKIKRNHRYKYIFGNPSMITPEMTDDFEAIEDKYHEMAIKPFVESSLAFDKEKIDIYMEGMDQLLKEEDTEYLLSTTMKVYLVVICEIGIYLESVQDDLVNVYGKKMCYYDHLKNFSNLSEIKIFMRNWIEWFMDYMSNQSTRLKSNIIEKSKSYILMNYTRPDLSIIEISEAIGFSEKHFSSLFSKEVGSTYKEYLTNLRIEEAKKRMVSSNMKVYEIANEVGYNNVEHFSRVFKKYTGFSPAEYKKSHF